ncbi:MAG: HAMP domain-containing histidine kinase [Desulfamplus sp.]|nr:HAMP domain-containing histidine kinase [Desulfamplus sp.]
MLHLNIRQKITIGMVICVVLVGLTGTISYQNLYKIEQKQHLVEIADDLSNIILEVRRYEKNYLLYVASEDFSENREYINKGVETVKKIAPELKYLKGVSEIERLYKKLIGYRSLMDKMAEVITNKSQSSIRKTTEEELREEGKELVELSQQLVIFERGEIIRIIKSLKKQMILSALMLLAVSIFLITVMTKKIIKPLRDIEAKTLQIAEGKFEIFTVTKPLDETQRVLEAYNRMITELERHQKQLIQAEKLSSLGILTSGIAHQLNNPLNNISTSCQILIEEINEAEPEFSGKMLGNIQNEVYRARDIVKGLLEFSREKEFSFVPTSLYNVVEHSIRLISSQVPPGIEITRDVPKDLMPNIDTQGMQQVFLNLMMNAIQAIQPPPGSIKISAKADMSQQQAIVTIEDTGIGISKEIIGRVFDPFFTTKDVGKGTGLGLSVVYGIIQKHKGTISAESEEGEGTRFTICLPLKADEIVVKK